MVSAPEHPLVSVYKYVYSWLPLVTVFKEIILFIRPAPIYDPPLGNAVSVTESSVKQ